MQRKQRHGHLVASRFRAAPLPKVSDTVVTGPASWSWLGAVTMPSTSTMLLCRDKERERGFLNKFRSRTGEGIALLETVDRRPFPRCPYLHHDVRLAGVHDYVHAVRCPDQEAALWRRPREGADEADLLPCRRRRERLKKLERTQCSSVSRRRH